MSNICQKCNGEFVIDEIDKEYYKKFQVSSPQCCPKCRMQNLMSFRNERSLFKRKCDFSAKNILAIYTPESQYTVYDQEIWWSDKWDALSYGRDLDFSRPFFEQIQELRLEVPRINLENRNNENSEYCNDCDEIKDCYLCFNSANSKNCYYCNTFGYGSRDCMDVFWGITCELSYECTKVTQAYHCFWCFNCVNISDCYFSEECIGCKNCFGCVGLRQKEYCLYNEQLSRKEYEEYIDKFTFSHENIAESELRLAELKLKVPHKNLEIFKSEDCLGDYISNSKNCTNCFDIMNSENSRYIWDGLVNNSYDCFNSMADFSYCSLATYTCNNVKFCNKCSECSDLIYCDYCFQCDSCFGCVGLRHKKFCILNKQYTKEEYHALLPKIIEHMQSTGEYGEFFPAKFSPFGYNNSMAAYHFPLNREEALAQGFNWSDYKKPELNIANLPETAIKCEKDGQIFRVIPQEIAFYKKHKLPTPRLCPDCRHLKRKQKMNPRILWDRECSKCGCKVKSTYLPDCKEKIDCEKCYLEEIY